MKRVVSVSLGSSKRNHAVETEILGEQFRIERIGTDGDMDKAIAMIRQLDGQVDAFGMGGIDLYVWAGKKRLVLRDAVRIAQAATKSPIVDGSGLKNTLERRVIKYLAEDYRLPMRGKKVLLVSGLDRFGMAEALVEAGCETTFGDLIFILGLPIPLRSLKSLYRVGAIVGPIVSQLPFTMLYPTGKKQESTTVRYPEYYHRADIIAGDFLFIKRYMPERLDGKTIITNTVTADDVRELARRGVKTLVTTTPELNGRSFGTNVMEGVLVAVSGKAELTPDEYNALLDRISFRPRIELLDKTVAL